MESSQLAANTRIALNARYVWPGARSRGARSLAWNASAVGFVDAIARSMQAKKAASRESSMVIYRETGGVIKEYIERWQELARSGADVEILTTHPCSF